MTKKKVLMSAAFVFAAVSSAFAQGRKGTAKLVKNQRPIVIPIKINGFRRAFDKKGLRVKVTGVKPTMEFKKPLDID